MRLLGKYQSRIPDFQKQELVQLLEQAIEQGDFNGGSLFDETEAAQLSADAQDFPAIPQAVSTGIANEETFNRPLNLVAARYRSLTSEISDFNTRLEVLLSLLETETGLLDKILASAELDHWISTLPQINGATKYSWDYGAGYGPIAGDLDPIDPVSGGTFTSRPLLGSFAFTNNGVQAAGVTGCPSYRSFPVKYSHWDYTGAGVEETSEGDGWTQLSVLLDRPVMRATNTPTVEVALPRGVASVPSLEWTAATDYPASPVWVRIRPYPRIMSRDVALGNALVHPDFASGWTLGTGWAQAGGSATHTAGTDSVLSCDQQVSVSPGSKLHVSFDYVCATGTDGTLRPVVKYYNRSGAAVTTVTGVPLVYNLPAQVAEPQSTPFRQTIQVPSNDAIAAVQITFSVASHTTGSWTVDKPYLSTPLSVSFYDVDPDSVRVSLNSLGLVLGTDFIVDDSGRVLLLNGDSDTYQVTYSERFPAYQCSVDQQSWSPWLMLDENRPYLDGTIDFEPISFGLDDQGHSTRFPVTDERGVPSGMFLRMLEPTRGEYLLRVSLSGDASSAGVEAKLQVEVERVTYLNGFQIAPYSTYPMRLRSVDAMAFGTAQVSLWKGDMVVDRPMTIRFPRQLVKTLIFTFYQESYTWKQYQKEDQNTLRRNLLFYLQSLLPRAVRRTRRAEPVQLRGVTYEFGFESLEAQDWSQPETTVIPIGPFTFNNSPAMVHFDAEKIGNVDFYLAFKAWKNDGSVADLQFSLATTTDSRTNLSGTYIPMTPGGSFLFPFNDGSSVVNRSQIDYVEIWIKAVIRDSDSLLQRFCLQVLPYV